MDTVSTAIIAMVDRMLEPNVSSEDIMAQVEELRETLDGMSVAAVLRPPPSLTTDTRRSPSDHLEFLAQQVNELADVNSKLEAEIAELRARLAQSRVGVKPAHADGSYTMEQFLSLLTAKLRRSYGWRTDYIRASQKSAECTSVTNEVIQRWQYTDKVPTWAVEQIERMQFPTRVGSSSAKPKWSPEEEEFLRQTYLHDPTTKNAVLAAECEARFKRPISENSIKGALDRMRKRGEVTKRMDKPFSP